MSKYINIDDISLRKTISVGGLSAKALWRRIQQAPSIDIVRCKECKHWRNTDAEKIPTASIACGNMHADDFCSYGVRKTNTTAEEKPTPIRDYMVHGEREGK